MTHAEIKRRIDHIADVARRGYIILTEAEREMMKVLHDASLDPNTPSLYSDYHYAFVQLAKLTR